jgi:hypothetical protein
MFICTSDLAGKKQGCQQTDGNVRIIFYTGPQVLQFFFFRFQLAARHSMALTNALQPLQTTITNDTTTLQTQEAEAIQQIQAAGNATVQNITSQIQASQNTAQQYATSLNLTAAQAQGCLTQQTQNLTDIAISSRK